MPEDQVAASLSPEDPPTHSESSSSKSRRSTVRVACNACRAKKIRCDGQRPVCGRCASQPGVICVYDTGSSDETRSAAVRRENETLRRNLGHAQGLLQPLLSLPEDESIQMLKRLRWMRAVQTGPFANDSTNLSMFDLSNNNTTVPRQSSSFKSGGMANNTAHMRQELRMPSYSSADLAGQHQYSNFGYHDDAGSHHP